MEKYITSWGLHQSITQKIPTTERMRLYKHWKNWHNQKYRTLPMKKEEFNKELKTVS